MELFKRVSHSFVRNVELKIYKKSWTRFFKLFDVFKFIKELNLDSHNIYALQLQLEYTKDNPSLYNQVFYFIFSNEFV